MRRVGIDQPFVQCTFEATPAFESVRSLFDEELRLVNDDQIDEWMVAYERLTARGLRLRSVATGEAVEDVLVHVEGDRAWFRN